MQITKAIIPVAGFGSRRLPITKAIEKCMLPIGNRPIVDYVVQDCVVAGITDIYFVVSSTNTQLEAYYGINKQLNEYLINNNKQDLLAVVSVPDINFHYIVQSTSGKYGTAIPVALAAPVVKKGESVVVLMGDDFIYNRDGSSEIKRLLEVTPDGGSSMLGVDVAREQVGRYGVLELDKNDYFVKIVEKPKIDDAPSTLINISKYVFNYDLLQCIVEYSNKDIKHGEYYITEPINDYVSSGGSLRVVRAMGEYMDGGTLDGWLQANNAICNGH